MNVPYSWIKEFVKFDKDIAPADFRHLMCMTGTEICGWENHADKIDRVVVCRIIKTEKHPDADRLTICQVDIGADEPIQIVTAATNMKEGDLVPVALDNSKLYDGTVIKKGKLRGVESNGMFCSVAELGLTTSDYPGSIEDGLLILNDGKPGQSICDLLHLDDNVFEADIVTNRPDCLSIIGVAREAACTFRAPFNIAKPTFTSGTEKTADYIKVNVEATDLCPRYMARVVTDIKIGPSPLWMIERLRECGVRSINNIVDITNYVMLEYGQPMHAFDYSCVSGHSITVRRAGKDEKMTTLDGQERTLSEDMLVIADADKPIALAGIMGGENSEIKNDTTTVVFESANFFAASVRKTAKAVGLRTESSARFEKNLDVNLAEEALDRACQLIELLGAGKVANGTIDICNYTENVTTIKLEREWINNYISLDVPEDEMIDILERLGMTVENGMIKVPSFRSDLENKYDISEEIAKFYGYDNIQPKFFKADVQSGGYTPVQKFEKDLGIYLRGAGVSEIQTYSFVSPKGFDKIRLPENAKERFALKIQNPLGEDSSIMRTTPIPSMMDVLARNYANRIPEAYLYEIATVYIRNEDDSKLPDEKKMICVGMYGNCDFFELKGVLESVFDSLNILPREYVAEKDDPTFHPGRTARIIINGNPVGIMGQIHPEVASTYGIDSEVYCAVVPFDTLYGNVGEEKTYRPIPKYPAVTRDIALLCDEAVYAGQVEKIIRQRAGKSLEELKIFDIYRGTGIADGKKSMAYSLTLRDPDKTLRDEDVESIMKKVLNGLEKEGITLRQ